MPGLTRRSLLRTGVTLGAAAAPVIWAGNASAAPVRRLAGRRLGRPRAAVKTPGSWSRDNFTPHLSKVFTVTGGSAKVSVKLIKIDNLIGSVSGSAQRQFSLLFQAPLDADLPSGLCTLRGAGFRPMTLFLSPVGQNATNQHLQAVVNRLA